MRSIEIITGQVVAAGYDLQHGIAEERRRTWRKNPREFPHIRLRWKPRGSHRSMQVVRNFIACERMKVCMRTRDNTLRLNRVGHGKPPGARNDDFRRKLDSSKMTRRINLHRIARSHCQPHYLLRCPLRLSYQVRPLDFLTIFQGLPEKTC